MAMDKKSDTIIIRVEEELKKDLQKLADEARRTLSDFIRLELEDLVKKAKK